jgi:cobalt-precorrin 5A hydrolase
MKRIVALTQAGRRLGQTLESELADAELWYKPAPFAEKIQQAFTDKNSLIMICATGIVFRTLAPVIKDKHEDAAVVVIDEAGEFVIPLLSGHQGGANQLAHEIAELIGAQVVLTTANPYLRPVFTVGMGCERDCDQAEMMTLLETCLQQAGLSIDQIDSINSIDLKQDEQGLIALAGSLQKAFQVFDKEQLGEEESLLSTRSDYVFQTVGVYAVAESAALHAARLSTGNAAELVLNKHKSQRATCAIARSYPSLSHKA